MGQSLTDTAVEQFSLTKWSKWLLASIAATTVILYVIVFTVSPMSGEDFALTRQFGSEGFIDRMLWVIDRSVVQSSEWNARLGEQLAIFWRSMPKVFFTLAATAAFLLLVFFCATLITGIWNLFVQLAVSIALIFALWPGMEVFFWGTANAGYLQPMLLLLACMYFYRDEAALSRVRRSGYRAAGIAILAFFGGLSFENAPVAVVAYMGLSLFFQGRALVSFRTLAPIVSMVLGWLLLLSAPSTALRSEHYKVARGIDGLSFDYLVARAVDVIAVFSTTALPLLGAALISAVYLFVGRRYRLQLCLMLFTSALVVASMAAAPYTEPRAFLLAWALLFAVTMAGLFELLRRHRLPTYLLVVVCALGLYFPLAAHAEYVDYASVSNAREAYIVQEVDDNECNNGVTVNEITKQYPYKYLNNRDSWYAANDTGYVSDYYHCKVIVE